MSEHKICEATLNVCCLVATQSRDPREGVVLIPAGACTGTIALLLGSEPSPRHALQVAVSAAAQHPWPQLLQSSRLYSGAIALRSKHIVKKSTYIHIY